MPETFPPDSTLNALSGSQSASGQPFPAIGDSPWYTSYYKDVYWVEQATRLSNNLRVYPGDLLGSYGVYPGSFRKADGTVVTFEGDDDAGIEPSTTVMLYLDNTGALQTAFSYPADSDIYRLGTITTDADGNLTTIVDDRVIAVSDTFGAPTDISGKADKVVGAVSGNVATLNSSGNLVDGGVTMASKANASTVTTLSGTVSTHVAATTAHGTTGTVVGTSDTQTLSNKTFSDGFTTGAKTTIANLTSDPTLFGEATVYHKSVATPGSDFAFTQNSSGSDTVFNAAFAVHFRILNSEVATAEGSSFKFATLVGGSGDTWSIDTAGNAVLGGEVDMASSVTAGTAYHKGDIKIRNIADSAWLFLAERNTTGEESAEVVYDLSNVGNLSLAAGIAMNGSAIDCGHGAILNLDSIGADAWSIDDVGNFSGTADNANNYGGPVTASQIESYPSDGTYALAGDGTWKQFTLSSVLSIGNDAGSYDITDVGTLSCAHFACSDVSTAPTTAGTSTPTGNYYGSGSGGLSYLSEPDAWVYIVISGTPYRIPLYS